MKSRPAIVIRKAVVIRKLSGSMVDDVRGEAQSFQQSDGYISDVKLPPLVTMGGAALMGMMVVVPAVAIADQGT